MADDTHKRREDPTAQLSPTARRLVAAARRLLARDGFAALTVEAVAAEAGAYRDSVRYYFGSKAALVAAVVDSLAHDQSLTASDQARSLASGGERVHGLVLGERNLVDDRDAFRDFFAIFPHVLQDEELRWRIAELYEWYRELFVASLRGPGETADGRLRDVAALMAAVTDGLAVQKLLDPDGVDLEALFALWERMLRRELGSGEAG